MIFEDRSDAGRQLAGRLAPYAGGHTRVLALPRGGVPIGYEVARALNAPLDVFVVRKIGAPGHEELALGAIASGGVRVLNRETIALLQVDPQTIEGTTARELRELERREEAYRGGLQAHDVADRTVILVDDGMATGASMHAAILALRVRSPKVLVVAVPVAPVDTCRWLAPQVDDLAVLETPEPFRGVGAWYANFSQIADDEVRESLARGKSRRRDAMIDEKAVVIDVDGKALGATLSGPPSKRGLVIFAHGSGSSRHSPRNRFVAESLNALGLATVLIDLLTPDEEEIDRRTAALRFDIALLARRIDLVTSWSREQAQLRELRVGYFGASTGAAAALLAASTRDDVDAIVSRGGRPDLAGDAIGDVQAPTLLIIGERDPVVVDLNRRAASHFHAHCEIAIVPGATHLFEEPGTLERVAHLAHEWFVRYLATPAA